MGRDTAVVSQQERRGVRNRSACAHDRKCLCTRQRTCVRVSMSGKTCRDRDGSFCVATQSLCCDRVDFLEGSALGCDMQTGLIALRDQPWVAT